MYFGKVKQLVHLNKHGEVVMNTNLCRSKYFMLSHRKNIVNKTNNCFCGLKRKKFIQICFINFSMEAIPVRCFQIYGGRQGPSRNKFQNREINFRIEK